MKFCIMTDDIYEAMKERVADRHSVQRAGLVRAGGRSPREHGSRASGVSEGKRRTAGTVIRTADEGVGVDTPEDAVRIEAILRARQQQV